MSTKTDLQTISNLLGDALSQFAKLFQNEVDLAKAELGEKVQQTGRAVVFLWPARHPGDPSDRHGPICAFGGLDRGRMVTAGFLSDLSDRCRGPCGRVVYGRNAPT